MKGTTLDLTTLHNMANYYSELDTNAFSFVIHRMADTYSVVFVNDRCKKQFGNLQKEHQIAKDYLPKDIWLPLKTLLENTQSNIVTKQLGENYKITLLVVHEEKNSYYFCALNNTKQASPSVLFEHNLDPIITIEANGTIIDANHIANGKFGYKSSNINGKSFYEFISVFSKETVQKFIKNTVKLQKPIELAECGFKTIDGKTLNIFAKSIPIIEQQQVSKILLILRDITPYSLENSCVTYLTYHDQLTGVWNKKALTKHFQDFVETAKQRKNKVAIMSIDLERFKKINETYGSAIGDAILCEVVNRISRLTSESRYLYRLNGDNFIFVIQNATKEEIKSYAIQIINILKEQFIVEDLELSISASIGIATFPNDGGNVDELIRKSNQAQLYVKEKLRSGFDFYHSDMEEQFRNTALMEAHLRRAIEKQELEVYYQPQIELETGKITSCEALLRWKNPKFGFVSPGQFIPIAEDSGLIIEIGDWVIEQACKQLKEWKLCGISNIRIAVNISPKQFREAKLSSKIFQYLSEYDVNPKMLELEITESSMTDAEDTMIILKQLKSMGLIISIDDFGTGYSSLSYIKRYPIDIIKIDQSFIRDMDNDEKDRAIAKTIIHLAHSLGLDVIAEGVEKEEHVGFLKDRQCKKAQGFLFSKPVPIDQLMKNIPLS